MKNIGWGVLWLTRNSPEDVSLNAHVNNRRSSALWRTRQAFPPAQRRFSDLRSEEHTSELQSQSNLVCRLLLEKKKNNSMITRLTAYNAHLAIVRSFTH